MNALSPIVYVALVLFVAIVVLLMVRWVRLNNRRPEPGTGSAQHYVICRISKGDLIDSCAETWWQHWWGGLPYCDDVANTCSRYGGTVIRRE